MSELMHIRETGSGLQYWRSNDMFSDRTRVRCSTLLDEALDDMDPFDRIISDKEAELVCICQKREQDKARIPNLHSVISKASELPPEILSEVFTHACAESPVVLPPKKRECWWTIGHVCSRWRQVLWNSPTVWADIHIRDMQFEDRLVTAQHHRIILVILEYVFANTNTLLSLSLWGNELPIIYELILSHTHRFRALSLRAIDWKTILSIVALPPQSFTNLETLQVTVKDEGDLSLPPALDISSLQHTPNLRSVTYSCYVDNLGTPRSPNRVSIPRFLLLPWENLTDLAVTFMPIPPSELHAIFSRCLLLVTCQVLCTDDPVAPLDHFITLPRLEKLEISTSFYHETVDWVNFLGPLLTPSLKNIEVRALTMPSQALTSLISRSKCSLTRISLQPHDIKFQDPHIESMLPHLESATTLCLGFPIPALAIKKINDGLLPALTYGELVVQPDGWEAVLDLVDLRIQQGASPDWKFGIDLVCLGGRGFPEVQNRYLRYFQEYRNIQGLRLSFWDAVEGREIEPDDDKYW